MKWEADFRRFLRERKPWDFSGDTRGNLFPLKTINLNTGLITGRNFCEKFLEYGVSISDEASRVLTNPAFTVRPSNTGIATIKLATAFAAELGFKDKMTYSDICSRAKEFDMNICPIEVPLQLRLQYIMEQPSNEELLICTNPVTDSKGNLYVFEVAAGGTCVYRLSIRRCNSTDLFEPESFWVFSIK